MQAPEFSFLPSARQVEQMGPPKCLSSVRSPRVPLSSAGLPPSQLASCGQRKVLPISGGLQLRFGRADLLQEPC
jgi:hypothetical protein